MWERSSSPQVFSRTRPRFSLGSGLSPYLTRDAVGRTLAYKLCIQNSEVVFDYMESPEAFSEALRQLETERTEQLKKIDEHSVSLSNRLTLQRFFARTDFVPSKTSISRRSRPSSAATFNDSRTETLVFMLSDDKH